ncbi:MAG: ABC transporter permease subunit [Chloroflexi bacterium]|nr:ABC transporter permease subunit [Chloroflexota bacterium]
MRNALTIARREVGTYFTSPLIWILATAFLVFSGLIFALYISQPGAEASMAPLLGLYGTVLLFVTPMISMRLLAEEQRSGTLELLMTSPLNDWQLVLGKWLGGLTALLGLVALTLIHVGIMARLATNGMATGILLGNYLGLVLLAASLLALGVLTSSLTESQVVAGFLGIMLVMILWFLPILGEAPSAADNPILQALAYLGLSDHYLNFGQGVIDSRDVIYFLTITIGSLFLATRIIETRRWR